MHSLVASCVCPDRGLNCNFSVSGRHSNQLSWLARATLILTPKCASSLASYFKQCNFHPTIYTNQIIFSFSFTHISNLRSIKPWILSSKCLLHPYAPHAPEHVLLGVVHQLLTHLSLPLLFSLPLFHVYLTTLPPILNTVP